MAEIIVDGEWVEVGGRRPPSPLKQCDRKPAYSRGMRRRAVQNRTDDFEVERDE